MKERDRELFPNLNRNKLKRVQLNVEGQALRYIKDSQKLMVGEIHIDIDNFKFFFKFIYLFMYSLLPTWGSNSRLCEIKS